MKEWFEKTYGDDCKPYAWPLTTFGISVILIVLVKYFGA